MFYLRLIQFIDHSDLFLFDLKVSSDAFKTVIVNKKLFLVS